MVPEVRKADASQYFQRTARSVSGLYCEGGCEARDCTDSAGSGTD